jgi:sulfide:quinone oxidoreductase
MSRSPLRVVVAGGGVAGLEALMGIRALAGDRVELALVATEDEFVYRPLAAQAPFAVGRIRRVPLKDAARHAGATFVATTIEAVEANRRVVRTAHQRELGYDALVLAVGAEPMPAVDRALTWDDRSDSELIGGLVRDLEEGYGRRLAVVIPPGPGWPLRGYELALFITLEARSMSAELETTLVTPDPPPLAVMGSRAVELVSEELERAGVTVVSAADVDVERGSVTTVVLRPSGQRVEVDRVIALPVLRGRRIEGVRTDQDGFVEVDDHGRVRGMDGVWAAGDSTAFPAKSGGLAAEQADVVAEDVAAAAGADVDPRPFAPGHRDELAGLPAGRFLKSWLAADEDEALTTHRPQACRC